MSMMSRCVVAGVDPSEPNQAAVDWAADEASRRWADLRLIHARHGAVDPAEARLLDGECARVSARHPELTVTVELVDDPPYEALTGAATDAALLVVGARGSGGFPGLLVGSTSLHVAARAACPIVVVRHTPTTRGGVVFGVEGRDGEGPPLAFAFKAARRQALALVVVHAWSYPLFGPGPEAPPNHEKGHAAVEREQLLSETLAGRRERVPDVDVTASVVRFGAAKELAAAAARHRLVVVGRHGDPGGPLGRLGSTSQVVVQRRVPSCHRADANRRAVGMAVVASVGRLRLCVVEVPGEAVVEAGEAVDAGDLEA
ncbi:universal stress protein [Kitasatospora sp. NPDC056531]|uniref:universal stress protein n=1 Tax=Kitasatospora sp. NPDC056531 TaxID=3345856 RepID=UPI0036BE7BEF